VACTIAPDDDLAISHLHASFVGVQRVDLVMEDLVTGTEQRLTDLSFDPASDEIVLMPSARLLRTLDTASMRARLLSVSDGVERELGSYTFNHSRYR
jgi:hypothetical protein